MVHFENATSDRGLGVLACHSFHEPPNVGHERQTKAGEACSWLSAR
jgi:hypothetical protein